MECSVPSVASIHAWVLEFCGGSDRKEGFWGFESNPFFFLDRMGGLNRVMGWRRN